LGPLYELKDDETAVDIDLFCTIDVLLSPNNQVGDGEERRTLYKGFHIYKTTFIYCTANSCLTVHSGSVLNEEKRSNFRWTVCKSFSRGNSLSVFVLSLKARWTLHKRHI